jgi:6-phosphogluconolactonase
MRTSNRRLCKMLVLPLLFLGGVAGPLPAQEDEEGEVAVVRVYVGTYTRGASEGIYRFDLDLASGKPTAPQLAAEAVNPSFVAIHPSRKYLYAVGEVGNFEGQQNAGGVTAFKIDPETGDLTKLNSQVSGGRGPCHVSVDATGKVVLVANYGGGSVASMKINEDGSLEPASSVMQHEGSSVHPRRQTAPHAHSVNVDPTNRFAVVADLGLDQVLVYRLATATAQLVPHDPPFVRTPEGGGPRHLAFHPNGKYAYVNNELTMSVTAFKYDAEVGQFEELSTHDTLPEDAGSENNSTAEVLAHPSGKFLYVSNRGHDSIAIFRIKKDGTLQAEGHASTLGETPRNFGIDPTGRFLLAANQNSGTVVLFRIDPHTGALSPTGDVIEIPNPVCVRFVKVD